jgi:tetratricopeptide (TPR) repeat protein
LVEQRHETLEETIRPVPRRASADAAPGVRPASATRARDTWRTAGIGLALVAGLLAVFFVLPRLSAPPPVTDVPAEAESAPAEAEPALSPEERAALDAEAQRTLAALVTQQNQLEERHVAQWGGDTWARYQELSRNGDDAYLQQDFATAAEAYAEARSVGAGLLEEGFRLMSAALDAGDQALLAGDAAAAVEQFQFALSIAADNDHAREGLERARQLPQVLELMHQAQAAESDGDLPAAIELYRQARALDPEWAPARQALARASGNLEAYQFERRLSQGFAALGSSDFDDAIEQFEAALRLRPDSEQARDGLFQAQEGFKVAELALTRVRALALERRELWSQAIELYESALATDPTLEYAQTGLERARARRDLEVKILNLIDNPRLLFDDRVLADAQHLREQAEAVDQKGARLGEQLAKLDRLLELATTPLPVVLHSDALTQVTVYRVGTIGSFTETQIALRPGEYTAIGSRNGYRDVRRQFTVVPGEPLPPIEVVCVEPI